MMFKKFITVGLLMCSLVAMANVEAYEYDKDAIKKNMKIKGSQIATFITEDISKACSIENNVYEDEVVKIALVPVVQLNDFAVQRSVRDAYAKESIIMTNMNFNALGQNTWFAQVPALELLVQNKTGEPMKINLEESMFTICSYQGKCVYGNVKYNEMQSTAVSNLMIFPKATKTTRIYRCDHVFYPRIGTSLVTAQDAKWAPPRDLRPNVNLSGDTMIKVNDKYITMQPSFVIDENKLLYRKIRQ